MTVRPIITLLLLGALATVPTTAGASVEAKPLPVKTWKKVTNDICRQGDLLLEEIADEVFAEVPPDGQPSLELMTAFVEQAAPVVQQRIDSIDALREPTKLRKKVKQLLATAQDELDAFVADPAIGLEANPFSATELASGKLGLQQCA